MQRAEALEGIPTQMWRMVALAYRRLLMLDYDGTLAPFTTDRDEAWPLPRSVSLLRLIAETTDTTVAIVSGRPLGEVERLAGDIPAIFVGEHGWERRAPDGVVTRRPLDPTVAGLLDQAESVARERGWGKLLERKRTSVVLHTRALPADSARDMKGACEAEWRPLARAGHMTLDRIDGGIELRARGRNKGTVVLSLLSQVPTGTLGVYVGDDVTDEDAFEVVRDWGFGVRVGLSERHSLAAGRVPSCEAVALFLEEWLAVAGPARG